DPVAVASRAQAAGAAQSQPGGAGSDSEEAINPAGTSGDAGGGEKIFREGASPRQRDQRVRRATRNARPDLGSGGSPARVGATGQPREGGNAIYKIDKEGLVTEVFRQPVLVLSMIEQDGTLLVGTGSDGLIYQINPAAEETVVLAKVEPKAVMSLLPASGGRI